jgi:hypothetical protein
MQSAGGNNSFHIAFDKRTDDELFVLHVRTSLLSSISSLPKAPNSLRFLLSL